MEFAYYLIKSIEMAQIITSSIIIECVSLCEPNAMNMNTMREWLCCFNSFVTILMKNAYYVSIYNKHKYIN